MDNEDEILNEVAEGEGFAPEIVTDEFGDNYVLEYVEDDDTVLFGEALSKATDALGIFSIDEILDFNGVDFAEAVAILYQTGEIGLPAAIEDDEPEDIPPEEIEE